MDSNPVSRRFLDTNSLISENNWVYEIVHYITADGTDLIEEWISGLKDRKSVIAIDRRIQRIELGNFGDHKPCQDGVWELRIDVGPGYRVYYAIAGKMIVLLLCGGDKGTQSADIKRACKYWKDFQERE